MAPSPTGVDQAVLDRVKAVLGPGPGIMLNMLRFTGHNGTTPHSASYAQKDGMKLWTNEYLAAFRKVADRVAPDEVSRRFISVNMTGVVPGLAGEDPGYWHGVALVQYPSFEVFEKIATDPEYAELAQPIRMAALEDWKLIAMKEGV